MASKDPDHSIVYIAINLLNDKAHVGATQKHLSARQSGHMHCARKGQSGKFYSAIRKYGEKSFKFLTIHKCKDFFEALEYERIYIARLKPEYNMTIGGGGIKGYKFSLESRSKISASRTGQKANTSAAHASRRKQVQCLNTLLVFRSVVEASNHFGITSAQTIKYCRGQKNRRGIKLMFLSDDKPWRRPMTETEKEACAERIRRVAPSLRKRVRCINDSCEFTSVNEAAVHYGLNAKSLATVARGERASVSSLKFEYVRSQP